MTNSVSWWANKLNSQQPRGITIQPQPVQAPQPQPQAPQPPAAPPVPVLDEQRNPNDEVSMGDALRLWKGGEAHRTEGHLACPSCGSATGYTAYSGMSAGGARVNGQQPRPHCFECGYNGAYSQALESNWA